MKVRAVRRFLTAMAALALATTAAAEVRLLAAASGRAVDVRVTPAAGGIWSPTAAGSTRNLNPLGDRIGDGAPVHATRGDAVLVAWWRPSTSELRIAVGRHQWASEVGVRVRAPEGDLRVIPAWGGWLLLSSDVAVDSTDVRFVTDDGQIREAADTLRGTIFGSVVTGEAVLVGSALPDGTLRLSAIILPGDIPPDIFFIPVPDPGPIVLRSPRTTLQASAIILPGDLEPIIFLAPRPIGRATPAGASAMSAIVPIGDDVPIIFLASARPQLKLVAMRDGGVQVAALWWESPQTLAYVPVDQDGPTTSVTSITAKGNSTYSPSLIQQALRDLASR